MTYDCCPHCRRKLEVAYVEGEGGGGICPTCDFVPRQDFDAAGRQNGHTPQVDVVEPVPEGGRYFLDQRAVTVRVADVRREGVHWLWRRRIPFGRLTALLGDPGVGKSWLTLAVAAAVTRGATLPGDDTSGKPSRVLVLTAEDGLADTVRPRLEDMGADLTLVHVLTATRDLDGRERFPSLADDLSALDAELQRGDYVLLIVDPINAYLGTQVDSHRDAAIRSVLGPLAQLAERHGVAVLFTLHLTKSGRDRAIYRGQGSIAYSAAARVVLLAGQDSETGNRALIWVKGNLSAPAPAIGYEIADARFAWLGESQLTAAQLLAPDADASERPAQREAEDFLRQVLADGPRPAKDTTKEAEEAGIARRTLWRAKTALDVVADREGEAGKRGAGKWVWRLPDRVYSASTSKGENNGTLNHSVSEGGPVAGLITSLRT